MRVDVALLPKDLTNDLLIGRSVVVFDVLRATSSIVTAIASGASRVRVFATHDELRAAARDASPRPLLAGESRCLRPADFDLGNSPSEHADPRVRGREIFLATTNGTRAIHASLRAKQVFVGALPNASTIAQALIETGNDVTLVCAGTQGEIADEDRCGAGAVIDGLLDGATGRARLTPSQGLGTSQRMRDTQAADVAHPHRLGGSLALPYDALPYDALPSLVLSDAARECLDLFRQHRNDLPSFLRKTTGGRNVIDAGLAPDIDWCARLDSTPVVPRVSIDAESVFITH
jgi:2-phosphosulfolactate phosphatase